jgi:hypothetical protein
MAEDGEEKEGYDPDLDVLIDEVKLDDKHVVQLRQYNGGVVKVCVMQSRAKKPPFAVKRWPATLAVKVAEAITAWKKAKKL